MNKQPVPDNFAMTAMVELLEVYVKRFRGSVTTRSVHPTYVTKAMLKEQCNAITAVFNFLLHLNRFQELPVVNGFDPRKEVERCQLIVEAQYAKDKLPKKGK